MFSSEICKFLMVSHPAITNKKQIPQIGSVVPLNAILSRSVKCNLFYNKCNFKFWVLRVEFYSKLNLTHMECATQIAYKMLRI